MMTLPDFKEKQILFIQAEQGVENRLRFINDNILFQKDEKNINRVSCHKVFALFIFGDFSITTKLIKKCKEYGISIFLLKTNFEVYAMINSGLESNYLLRQNQYACKNEFEIAKNLMKNKTYNQICLLKETNKISNQGNFFSEIVKKIEKAQDEKELLGIEGSVSKNFFKEYFSDIGWVRRMPRTKYDINNVLLDIGYTFVFNFVDSLLNLYGFDTYKGFYHKLFFSRKSLACDITEPFRCLIDKQLLKSYNLKQIDEKDFKILGGKYVLSYEKQKKYLEIFFNCIMNRKEEIFLYVKDFYYYLMKDGAPMPFFRIK